MAILRKNEARKRNRPDRTLAYEEAERNHTQLAHLPSPMR